MKDANLDFDDELENDAELLGITDLELPTSIPAPPLTESAPIEVPATDKEIISLALTTLEECGLVEPIFNEWCEEYLTGKAHSLKVQDVRKSLEDHKRRHKSFYWDRYGKEQLRINYGLRTALCVLRYLEIKSDLWLDRALFYARVALEIVP